MINLPSGYQLTAEGPVYRNLVDTVLYLKKRVEESTMPEVTADDNGKIIRVDNGKWVLKTPDALDQTTLTNVEKMLQSGQVVLVFSKEVYTDGEGTADSLQIIIPSATVSAAGVMSATDKLHLDKTPESTAYTSAQTKVNTITTIAQEDYDALVSAGTVDTHTLYIIVG